MATMTLMDLPLEIRLLIYQGFLAEHQRIKQSRQPSNSHMQLLRTCRQVYIEAGIMFRQYLSLRNEIEMERYCHLHSSADEVNSTVRWIDVANDGRMVETLHSGQISPASQLYLILRNLPSLEKLRVFNVRNYHPYAISVPHLRYHLDFEGAMFPSTCYLTKLRSYELYLDPTTRVIPFKTISGKHIESLRLSGDCHLSPQTTGSLLSLRHLTLRGITGNSFDQMPFNICFSGCMLQSFSHVQGHRLGFEIRNNHLESLVKGPGAHLRKLVLLGSSRLTSSVIASCLHNLPTLEYLALSLVTVNELRDNFVLAIGPSISVLKLQITHAWYATPLFEEERLICNALEERLLNPRPPLTAVFVSFHSRLMSEDGRQERWMAIAETARLVLKIGPWEDDEET
ncbi:hypothetical protein BJ138DRAFT_1149504 [Hygrophoropsis aurantiaca]|uniref:Uncharacterized protein n=1 Tax=Hygrophoropsis aurantiaca TaxID=72124 RepID=A0ACB8AFH6_9AGAM|nr:hypothetical protein BJ138DRAFT_1149504 [Hygrophoropsis aurantiaca]